jgi:hypothetical protein
MTDTMNAHRTAPLAYQYEHGSHFERRSDTPAGKGLEDKMITPFVAAIVNGKADILQDLMANPPQGYGDLVKRFVSRVADAKADNIPDVARITCINHGKYQGTKVYVIGANGHRPDTYFLLKVSYGSCSVCDTFQRIQDPKAEQRAEDYYRLMLHMVQQLKEV